jgi:hypothetical protein
MKTCLFCGVGRPSRAHVLPEWLAAYLKIGRVNITQQSSIGNRARNTVDSFDVVVRAVCAPCNGGWLSVIENEAKPLIIDLVEGNSRGFNVEERTAVARWIWAIALLFPRSTPDHFFRDEAYADFMKTRELPAVAIRTVSFNGQQRPGRLEMRTAGVSAEAEEIGRLLLVTMQIAKFSMELMHIQPHTGKNADNDIFRRIVIPAKGGFERDMVDLWPPLTELVWPTKRALTDAGYLAMRNRVLDWKNPS